MVEHWLHNSMVPGSNPDEDENLFFLSSYHFTTSLLTSFGSGLSMVPRWSPDGPPMVARWSPDVSAPDCSALLFQLQDFSAPRHFCSKTFQPQDFSAPRLFSSKTFQLQDFSAPRLFSSNFFSSKTFQLQDFSAPRCFSSKTFQPQMFQLLQFFK